MKKLLLLFSLLGTMFAFNAGASTIPEGAIIKTADNPDVYIVKYNAGKWYKRLVLNPMVFESYGHLRWEDIITVSDIEMDSYETSDLVRVDGTTDIYQLVPEGDTGAKYMITSLDGFDADSVYTINSVDFVNYNMYGTKESRYFEEVDSRNGVLKIHSNMPIKQLVINTPEEDVPLSSGDLSTWYGMDTPQYALDDTDSYDEEDIDFMSKTYYLMTRIIELKDLEELYIKIELPDGSIAYAKDFEINKIDGKWQMSSEHDGILMVGISDEKDENRMYDWTEDEKNIIPDTFQNTEFGFCIYLYMGYWY